MYRNLHLIVSIAFATHLLGMKEERDPVKDNYILLKELNYEKDYLVDTFFIDNKTLAIADNTGNCNFHSLDKNERGSFFRFEFNKKKGAYLQNVWYEPESKTICAVTNLYVDNSPHIKGKNMYPMQTFNLRVADRWSSTPLVNQTIASIDLKNMILKTYDFAINSYVIWTIPQDGKVSQIYPNKNDAGDVKSAAFFPSQSLCALTLLKKYNKYKDEKIILTTTTDWQKKWELQKRARNIIFSPNDGKHIVYNSKEKLYISNTKSGNTITTSTIPLLLKKISSIAYDQDGTHLHVIDSGNKKQAVFTHDGKYLRVEDVMEEQQKVVHSSDGTLKAVIEPHKITIYKKEEK